MEKYFELRENGKYLSGKIINIPDNVSIDVIKEKIEYNDDNSELIIVDKIFKKYDLEMDWDIVDFEHEIDNDFISVGDALIEAKKYNLESELIYTALKMLKNNSELTISEVINKSLDEWVK